VKNETHDSHLGNHAYNDPEHWRERALLRGMDEITDLLKPVEDALHPYRATFSPHDNPNQLMDWNVRQTLLKAAKEGKCKYTYLNLSLAKLRICMQMLTLARSLNQSK
jgi:hypothetical protein